jgi:membrane protein
MDLRQPLSARTGTASQTCRACWVRLAPICIPQARLVFAKFEGTMNIKQAWGLVKEAASSWVDDYASSMGAALAYYTMFSIAPVVLIVISVAGLVFGEEAARGEIIAQLQGLMGDRAAQAVQGLVESVSKQSQSAAATAIGVAMLLIGATTVFGELQAALDRIWQAPARDQHGGIWNLLRSRLLSFGMILGIGFLLMISLVLSAALAALGKWWGPLFQDWEVLAQVVNFVVGFGLTTVVFAMIYKIMPRVHIRWHDVWIGAAVTALLFSVGKFLIGVYIGRSAVASAFGAAGSLAVMLVWVYYSAQIFLLGAEFTWVYAYTYGSRKGQREGGPKAGLNQEPGRNPAADTSYRGQATTAGR